MTSKRWKWLSTICFAMALPFGGSAMAEDAISDLPPYKLVRSLEFIQDTIARGDLSALDMQKYLLSAIDDRFKKATPKDFDDHRNVNAALIYTMSGGNSDTLAGLVFNDAAGHFDIRITEALRMYLNGKSDAAVKRLEEMVPEYKSTEIGPYLALVAGNSVGLTSPKDALKYFDWARLNSPGGIIEETALRRSVALSVKGEMYDKAITYSKRYARRFILSPYAGQFADIFVGMVVDHGDHVTSEQLKDVLDQMEPSRAREVYLRIARKAVLVGKLDLARLCTEQAKTLLDGKSENSAVLTELYSGLVSVPTSEVLAALTSIASIPDEKLSPKDRNLRDAAKFIAKEVVTPPVSTSLTQAATTKVTANEIPSGEISTDNPTALPPVDETDPTAGPQVAVPPSTEPAAPTTPPGTQPETPAAATEQQDAPPASEIDAFVTDGRAKLDAIDAMLKKVP